MSLGLSAKCSGLNGRLHSRILHGLMQISSLMSLWPNLIHSGSHSIGGNFKYNVYWLPHLTHVAVLPFLVQLIPNSLLQMVQRTCISNVNIKHYWQKFQNLRPRNVILESQEVGHNVTTRQKSCEIINDSFPGLVCGVECYGYYQSCSLPLSLEIITKAYMTYQLLASLLSVAV